MPPRPDGATVGTLGGSFREIFDYLPEGAMLREATEEESATWIETWQSPADTTQEEQ